MPSDARQTGNGAHDDPRHADLLRRGDAFRKQSGGEGLITLYPCGVRVFA